MSSQADYFHEKYGMTKTHSAVVDAMQTVAPCKALDLGCGQGRNALYLSLKGFDVTASDYNPGGMGTVEAIAEAEGLQVRTQVYDMNQAAIDESYDFMVATVVFMFLQDMTCRNIRRCKFLQKYLISLKSNVTKLLCVT